MWADHAPFPELHTSISRPSVDSHKEEPLSTASDTLRARPDTSTPETSTSIFSSLAPVLALIAMTAVWGSSFVIIHGLVERIPPLDFLGVRFAIAGGFIAALRWRSLLRMRRSLWPRGIILGLAFAGGQLTQTIGLAHTEASTAGFITGLYVVLTPIVLFFAFRVRVPAVTWLAIIVATVGMAVLKLEAFAFGFGESIIMLAALLYALHIVLLGRWSTAADQADLTAVQMITLAVVFMTAASPDGIILPANTWEWTQMVYMALVAGLAAVAVQTWAQSKISPTKTAIILTGEPVFGAVFAVLFGGELLTVRMVIGGMLIVGAMLLAELYPLLRPRPALMPARYEESTLV